MTNSKVMSFLQRSAGIAFGLGALAMFALPTVAAAQTFTEYPVPTANGSPISIVAGPDGALWFTEQDGNKIGRITTAGVITEFTVPTSGSEPYGITVGPDGALWFTEFTGNKIGRITTAGVITELDLPRSGSMPYNITVGPDGALWFTEYTGNKIGRITTAGVITEFTIPTSESFPYGITVGPDGALWFTEGLGNKIGRITTAGVITEFTIPTSGSEPFGITVGPDGALWFAEFTGNKIGRITTAGVITEFTVPTSGSEPYVITVGPDGALWFTEGLGNKIGRITTAGVITEFTVPTSPSFPIGIAVGPDGALWFTEQEASKIGRFVPPTPPTSSPLLASVLPASRSVQVGSPETPSSNSQPMDTVATAFATIINTGTTTATACSITSDLPASSFEYQTTDPATNAVTGNPNTPVDIAAGGSQSFVIALTPVVQIVSVNVSFLFSCTNVAVPAGIVPGVNTLLISASTTPTPDVIALSATLKNDGIVHVTNGSPPTGVFAVASDNLGSGDTITIGTNTGSATLPITVTVCQTDPTTGVCMQTPSAMVSTTINPNNTPTFGIFVLASNSVPFDPTNNRIFVTFTDSTNTIRGETSVAVETQ